MRFLREKFSTRLATEMERAKIKQAHLAAKLGVAPTSVYQWLQAEALPKDDAFTELCNIFGIKGEEWFSLPVPEDDKTVTRQARDITRLEELLRNKTDMAEQLTYYTALIEGLGFDPRLLHDDKKRDKLMSEIPDLRLKMEKYAKIIRAGDARDDWYRDFVSLAEKLLLGVAAHSKPSSKKGSP